MENNDINLGPRKAAARKLAQNLIKKSQITEAPVSLQKIIEILQVDHDLEVHRVNFGEKISGLLVTTKDLDKEYVTIGFNENHPWCRRRFTIAHEIGHLLLGHTCGGRGGDDSYNEVEADIFAAELLVPKTFLKSDFKKFPNIPELSKLYRVSQQTMGIKLGQDRLI